jgi:hypothetical protein
VSHRVAWIALAIGLVSVHSGLSTYQAVAQGSPPASDADGQDEVKAAFESAKQLGTADAWNAFLTSYPNGFYADLARAYLKKADETAPEPATNSEPPPSRLPPSSARAAERSCADRPRLKSQHSKEPTKITFVNQSGMYRAIMWIDFDGSLKDYGGLNSGDELVLDTFRTHPWMIATGPGDCLQIFLPAAEPARVELLRLAADDGPVRAATPAKAKVEKKPPPPKKLVCAKNYQLQKGKCVLLQNCGSNAYRSPEGDCYCKKGYVMRAGKCQWPQNKNGFEIEPWKKQGCSTWQAQCNQGNAGACGKYEANCQVN